MRNTVLAGATAGAVGTTLLNVITYGDMVLRGRPESHVPAEVAGTLARDVGVNLAGTGDGANDVKQHRQSGLGALMGYTVGIGLGTLYGALHPHTNAGMRVLAGVGIGLAAMVASDLPAILLKKTNLKEWNAVSWASDVIPHLAYGLGTAAAFDALHPTHRERDARGRWQNLSRYLSAALAD